MIFEQLLRSSLGGYCKMMNKKLTTSHERLHVEDEKRIKLSLLSRLNIQQGKIIHRLICFASASEENASAGKNLLITYLLDVYFLKQAFKHISKLAK